MPGLVLRLSKIFGTGEVRRFHKRPRITCNPNVDYFANPIILRQGAKHGFFTGIDQFCKAASPHASGTSQVPGPPPLFPCHHALPDPYQPSMQNLLILSKSLDLLPCLEYPTLRNLNKETAMTHIELLVEEIKLLDIMSNPDQHRVVNKIKFWASEKDG